MRINRLSLIIGFVIVVLTILLSSCEHEPFVSRNETVEGYNASIDFVRDVENNQGYNFKSKYHYAKTYYKYVIFDDNVKCPEVKSPNPIFKTESDSPNGPIQKNDKCIDCGYKWIDHKRW